MTSSRDETIQFYDVVKLAIVRVLRVGAAMTALCFAFDGIHIACGTEHGELMVRVDGHLMRSHSRAVPVV